MLSAYFKENISKTTVVENQLFEISKVFIVVVLFLRFAQKQHNNNFPLFIRETDSYFEMLVENRIFLSVS